MSHQEQPPLYPLFYFSWRFWFCLSRCSNLVFQADITLFLSARCPRPKNLSYLFPLMVLLFTQTITLYYSQWNHILLGHWIKLITFNSLHNKDIVLLTEYLICVGFLLRGNLTVSLWLAWNLLCILGWHWNLTLPPESWACYL